MPDIQIGESFIGAGAEAAHINTVLGDREGQVGQGGAERAGQGGDHLAGRLLAAPLDLRQVLGRDSGPVGGLCEGLVPVGAQRPQAGPEHLPPQWLQRPAAQREDPADLAHGLTVGTRGQKGNLRSPAAD